MLKKPLAQTFKTDWLSRAPRKARIGDSTLIAAIREVMQGRAYDLGAGVFKKRLCKNMLRSIVPAAPSATSDRMSGCRLDMVTPPGSADDGRTPRLMPAKSGN